MSCSTDSCKCMFSVKQIWSGICLPSELVTNFKTLDVFLNGCLFTPSFVFGKKGSGDYDLMDDIMVFCQKVKNNDIVNVIWKNSKYTYIRESNAWKLIATLER